MAVRGALIEIRKTDAMASAWFVNDIDQSRRELALLHDALHESAREIVRAAGRCGYDDLDILARFPRSRLAVCFENQACAYSKCCGEQQFFCHVPPQNDSERDRFWAKISYALSKQHPVLNSPLSIFPSDRRAHASRASCSEIECDESAS
jgi:hypothetical protein